jgi:hypothetical protein
MNETLLLALLSPVLLTVGGIISWIIKSKKEEIINAEEKSREFKLETYKKLLEPFVATFTNTIDQKIRKKEIDKIKTLEYKRAIFDLTTFGSDKAIQIFNKIMQTFYRADEYKDDNGEYSVEYGNRLIALISELMLQIRKDLYSKRTKLKRSEMLEFMITDMKNTEELINNMKL